MNKIDAPAAMSATIKTILFFGSVAVAVAIAFFYPAAFFTLIFSAIGLYLVVGFWSVQYANAKKQPPASS